MAWNPKTVALLPYSIGDEFPAYFTCRAGIDMHLIDLMRALFDKGKRPGSFAYILLEMHTKRRSKLAVKYEKRLLLEKALNKVRSYEPYPSFADPTQYCGHVTTGQYLSFVLNKFRRAIEPYLDLEVKKLSGKFFAIDAQFKEAKHLCQYKGLPLFKATVTIMNEYNEIRTQFHVVSDGHDQYVRPIVVMVKTIAARGQEMPKYMYTDNPTRDSIFLNTQIPSLEQEQSRLDAMVVSRTQDGTPQPTGYFVVNHGDYFYHNKADEINQAVDLIRNLMQEQGDTFVGLDAEWGTVKSPDGRIIGSQGIATLQIAFCHNGDGGQYKARVFHLCVCDHMPHHVEAFMLDEDLTFVGCQVRVMRCIWNMCTHILYTQTNNHTAC
jgi:hypothetical protein